MTLFTAIIVAKGNPWRLEECVRAIAQYAHEVVIVDIGLEQAPLAFLHSVKNVRIEAVNRPVPYVELIREESKRFAKTEYVLFLDPDEIVGRDLGLLLQDAVGTYDYISIARRNIIFGKWIRHTRWWPDYQVRFFRQSAVVWPKIIHSQPEVKGEGYSINPIEKFALTHYNYESVDEYLSKLPRYTKAEAQALIDSGKSFTFSHALSKGLGEFMSRYFAGEGYKDGVHGLVLSFLQMYYYILVWVYYWELKKYPEQSVDAPVADIKDFFRSGLYETNFWAREAGIEKTSLRDRIEQHVMGLRKRVK